MAAARESFLLRLDPVVMDGLRRWARDDLRSVNAQAEYLLRRALRDAGRLSDEPEAKADKQRQEEKVEEAQHDPPRSAEDESSQSEQ